MIIVPFVLFASMIFTTIYYFPFPSPLEYRRNGYLDIVEKNRVQVFLTPVQSDIKLDFN